MFMIKPEFCSLKTGINSFITLIGPKKLVSNAFFISDSGVSSIGPVIPTPALLIRTSTLSVFDRNSFKADLMDSGFVTSILSNGKSAFTLSGFLLVPKTVKFFLTRKSAIAFPIPEEAPVIKTTWDIKKCLKYKGGNLQWIILSCSNSKNFCMNSFMKRAIELAVQNVKNGGQPFGAVLVKDDKIIAEGI